MFLKQSNLKIVFVTKDLSFSVLGSYARFFFSFSLNVSLSLSLYLSLSPFNPFLATSASVSILTWTIFDQSIFASMLLKTFLPLRRF